MVPADSSTSSNLKRLQQTSFSVAFIFFQTLYLACPIYVHCVMNSRQMKRPALTQ